MAANALNNLERPAQKESPTQSRGLRIAVDFPWDASACMGTGAYSETMVRALAKSAPDSSIFLLVSRGATQRVHLSNVRYLSLPEADAREEGTRQVGLPSLLSAIQADCLFAPASLLPLVRVCPMVATVHDLTFARRPEYYDTPLVGFLDRWFEPSLRIADHLIAVSDETETELVTFGRISPSKVTVIEQPVRETFRHPLPENQSQAILRSMGIRSPFFFHVSNLSLHKNVFFALEVYHSYLSSHPGSDLLFIIAGGGYAPNQPPDFLAKAEELGVGNRVVYAGRVSDLELNALYQGCEAFLFPSLAEGWGLPVAEARALGARVLASPHVPAADPCQRLPLKVETWVRSLLAPKNEPKPLLASFETAGNALLAALKAVIKKDGAPDRGTVEILPSEPAGVKDNPEIAIRADWRSPSGLGQAARNVFFGLKAAGLSSIPVSTPKDGIQNPDLWPQRMVLHRERADLFIHTLPPDYYDLSLPGKHIGLFFWETDRLPEVKSSGPSWRETLNRLDEIWVAAPFLVDVLRNSGISRPIQVISLPMDTEQFSPGPRRPPPTDLPKGFDPSWTVVLYAGTWDARKRPDILVRAFTRAFSDKDRALLVLKSYVTGHEAQDSAILDEWVAGSRAGSGHVRIIPQVLSQDGMADLFRFATVFATASRGEGFCLPGAQAMSTGKPVLGVKWSALADQVSIPVRHRVEHVPPEVKLPGYSQAQRWAVIDEEDLSGQLSWVHSHRGEVMQLGRKAREWATTNLSFRAAGKRLRSHIEELLSQETVRAQGALA